MITLMLALTISNPCQKCLSNYMKCMIDSVMKDPQVTGEMLAKMQNKCKNEIDNCSKKNSCETN